MKSAPTFYWTSDKIILWVFITGLIIAFVSYSVIFIINKIFLKKIYTIKVTYNELQNFNQYINFNWLKVYKTSNENDQISQIYSILTKKKAELDLILSVTRTNILNLMNSQSNLDFKDQYKKIRFIVTDLEVGKVLQNDIGTLYINTQSHIDEVDSFFLNIVEIFNRIERFYSDNLSTKYRNPAYKEIIDVIKHELEEANKLRNNSVNFQQLSQNIEMIIKTVKAFLHIVTDTYKYDRIIVYLENKKNEIISSDYEHEGFNGDEITFIKQQVIIGVNSINKLKDYLQKLDFAQLESFARIGCNSLEKTLNKIITDKKINSVINTDISLLNNQIVYLISMTDNLFAAFNELEERIGKKNDEINKLLAKNKYQIVSILEMHTSLEVNIKNNDIPKNEIGDKIMLIIMNILAWINDSKKTVDVINETYNNFIKINDEISENKNIVGQLVNLKLKYSPKDIGGISALNTYYERITELEEKLYSDYDNNFKECNNDINKIHENLTNIIAETSGDVILYKYCEKLLMFLNKYRYEHIDVEKTLNDIQKRFTTKESSNDKCVEELISLAEKIKYSGKKYGIGIK